MSPLERGAAERLHAQERRWLDDARGRLHALPARPATRPTDRTTDRTSGRHAATPPPTPQEDR